jgi:superfamily I DNA/RNA helicase/intein/homing endonuclease
MPSERVIWGPPGTGKCVDPGTYVFTRDGMVPIGSLGIGRHQPDEMVPISDVLVQGRNGVKEASHFYDGGMKRCLKIRTRRGFELTGSNLHPVLALKDGDPTWVRLYDLRPGYQVALDCGAGVFPENYPKLPQCPPDPPTGGGRWRPRDVKIPIIMTETLAEWLGLFISEGCWYQGQDYSIGFCNFTQSIATNFFWMSVELFGLITMSYRPHNFLVSSTRLKRWLKILGADGLAAEKKVPDVILKSPKSCQKEFLRAMFEAEGSIDQKTKTIEFVTASEVMGRQIQLMLLNFGIVSKRSWKEADTKRWGRRKYWRIFIQGNPVIQFREHLGFTVGSIKQAKLDLVQPQIGGQWDFTGLPVEFVRKRYQALRLKMKEKKIELSRSFWRKAKVVQRSFSGNRSDGQSVVARQVVARGLELFSQFSEWVPCVELKEELDSLRQWDSVVHISDEGLRKVVDLTVPDGHSFTGNGIICHNTTAGTALARHWMSQGTSSNQIAYLAFTKAAAKAAAMKIFQTEDDTRMSEEFPYFRTIHSLCYRGLLESGFSGLRKQPLITTGDMKQFQAVYSMPGAYSVYDWEDLAEVYAKMEDRGRSEWDQALAAYTFSRIKSRTTDELDRARHQPTAEGAMMLGLENMSLDVYQTFVEKYERFKKAEGIIDFTDMLEFGVRTMKPFDDIRYFVVDEAQDLSPIHHAIVDRAASFSQEVWWIGDDDQAIFSFSGASAELFLERAKRSQYQIQLRQTHRFGQGIVDFADRIIKRVTNRHPKEIIGVEGREGRVEVSGAFEPAPWDPQDPLGGDTIIVHRHVAGCQNVAQAHVDAGLPFRSERGGRNPLDSAKRLKAWVAVRNLSMGKAVSMTAVENVLDELLPSVALGEHNEKIRLIVHGSKSRVTDLLKGSATLQDLMAAKILTPEGATVISEREYHTMKHSNDLDYYERVTKNGYDIEDDEAMRKIPRITTIHGAKGREAERAIVFSEMGDKCWGDPDNEHRLAYVAATRTMTNVTICMENTVHWARSAYDYPVQIPEEAPQEEPHA